MTLFDYPPNVLEKTIKCVAHFYNSVGCSTIFNQTTEFLPPDSLCYATAENQNLSIAKFILIG